MRAIALLGALGAWALAITGCAQSAEPSSLTDPAVAWQGGTATRSDASGPAPVGGQNITLWTLPLDEFLPEFGNRDNYAEQLLVASCLADQSISWPVPWQDVNEPASPVFNSAGRRLFTADIAEKYGFRTHAETTESEKLWETFLSYTPTEPNFQNAFDGCLADVREKYPLVPNEDTMYVRSAVVQAQNDAFSKPDVQAAAGKWRECAERLGAGELPENPNDFPGQALLEDLGAVPPAMSASPSPREHEIAVGHARCLDSSGFAAAMYAAEWELQTVAIERDRAKLDAVRAEVQARETAVAQIIATNAPKA